MFSAYTTNILTLRVPVYFDQFPCICKYAFNFNVLLFIRLAHQQEVRREPKILPFPLENFSKSSEGKKSFLQSQKNTSKGEYESILITENGS